jgi:hypothetical protein
MSRNEIPITHYDEKGIGYSDWVIGVYSFREAPYRIVRRVRWENGNEEWETIWGEGDDEDLFSIPEPLYCLVIKDNGGTV